MPVLHPDDQTALNESELDMEESVDIPPPVEIHKSEHNDDTFERDHFDPKNNLLEKLEEDQFDDEDS